MNNFLPTSPPFATLTPASAPFLRHIERCHNVQLPGDRLPFKMETNAGFETVGWLTPELLPYLRREEIKSSVLFSSLSAPDANAQPIVSLAPHLSLRSFSAQLESAGAFVPFEEWFDVRAPQQSPAPSSLTGSPQTQQILGQIDRGLIPLLGTESYGVHLNGLVRKPEGLFLWVAQRSATKRLDPGKLDHLVAGGVNAGLSPSAALLKEAGEEAAVPETLAAQARPVSQIAYAMQRPEGLRRDRLFCYDLELPENFVPQAADGEVESFHLLPLTEVFELVRDTDSFKFNVNLVLIDLFLRLHMFSPQDTTLLHNALSSPYSAAAPQAS